MSYSKRFKQYKQDIDQAVKPISQTAPEVWQVLSDDPSNLPVPEYMLGEKVIHFKWYIIDVGQALPDFGAGGPPASHYMAIRSDFRGSGKIGSIVTLKTATKRKLAHHLEGCEFRESMWLHDRKGKVVAYQYSWELSG